MRMRTLEVLCARGSCELSIVNGVKLDALFFLTYLLNIGSLVMPSLKFNSINYSRGLYSLKLDSWGGVTSVFAWRVVTTLLRLRCLSYAAEDVTSALYR